MLSPLINQSPLPVCYRGNPGVPPIKGNPSLERSTTAGAKSSFASSHGLHRVLVRGSDVSEMICHQRTHMDWRLVASLGIDRRRVAAIGATHVSKTITAARMIAAARPSQFPWYLRKNGPRLPAAFYGIGPELPAHHFAPAGRWSSLSQGGLDSLHVTLQVP